MIELRADLRNWIERWNEATRGVPVHRYSAGCGVVNMVQKRFLLKEFRPYENGESNHCKGDYGVYDRRKEWCLHKCCEEELRRGNKKCLECEAPCLSLRQVVEQLEAVPWTEE